MKRYQTLWVGIGLVTLAGSVWLVVHYWATLIALVVLLLFAGGYITEEGRRTEWRKQHGGYLDGSDRQMLAIRSALQRLGAWLVSLLGGQRRP